MSPEPRPIHRPWGRRLALGGVLLFTLLQWVPVDRSNPPVESALTAPPQVERILRRSCYDCHSHATRWPWYSRVAPISFLLASHVHEARRDLDFSRWPTFDFGAQEEIYREIGQQIRQEKMPLPSYLWLHREARLTEEDRKVLLDWARVEPEGE